MKHTCRILALILMLGALMLVSCEKPMPVQLGEIDDITKGYWGEGSSVEIRLSDYVSANEAEVSYTVASSNPSAAEAVINGDTLTVTLLQGEGSSDVTVGVVAYEEEVFTLSFRVHAKTYAKIACIGDSLTFGHSWPTEAFPVYLQEILGDAYTIGNFGCNGASITGTNPSMYLKYADQDVYSQSLEFAPDAIVLMLGTNDSKDWTAAEPIFASGYTDLVNTYREAFPDVKILMVTAPPTMENNRFSIPNDVIRDYVVPAQRELSAALDLPMLDFRQIMEELEGGYDDMLRQPAEEDGVHLSVDGAEMLAEMIAEKLKEF